MSRRLPKAIRDCSVKPTVSIPFAYHNLFVKNSIQRVRVSQNWISPSLAQRKWAKFFYLTDVACSSNPQYSQGLS
ncbi:hypothetical protein BGLA2_300056 [Burkholderia gladioli]|nr:hypothetical protein BGLA2_300056 [Burkholderia gladioli]